MKDDLYTLEASDKLSLYEHQYPHFCSMCPDGTLASISEDSKIAPVPYASNWPQIRKFCSFQSFRIRSCFPFNALALLSECCKVLVLGLPCFSVIDANKRYYE